MQIMLLACCMALLAGCQNETSIVSPNTKKPEKTSKYASILAKCKTITIDDTVQVHFDESMQDTFGVADTYQFIGTELDSAEADLFPTEVISGPKNYFSGIYACYTFVIDSNYTGIIMRTSSMNEKSSSIKLFTLDKLRDTLAGFTELADQWNIAKETSQIISWLYRTNERKLQAYIWQQYLYDHGLADENDTTLEITNSYYLVNLSKPKYDTSSSNTGNLLRAFQAVAVDKTFKQPAGL